jgi:O-glycosyl hydrolase/methionine-rich copper-binding protein CopC
MRARILGLLVVSLMLAGCGGGSSSSGGGNTAPTVTATTPSSGATGIAIASAVTATFSEAMNAATIGGATFTLTAASGAVTGTVTYSAATNTATFTPNASLNYSTQYTAIITTGATSSSGTALAANYNWSFTTTVAPAPTVSAVSPASGATAVAITTAVTANFSEAMSPPTINGSTFTLTPQGGNAIAATVTYSSNGNVATLTPNSTLAYNTQYTGTITTGVQSSQDAALASNYTWSFTTAAAPVPTVTAVSPASGAIGVAIGASVSAMFSQPMNSSTINGATFTLTGPGGASVAGAVSYSSATQTATFDPAANLAYGATYTATITTGASSTDGATLAANYSWTFTTASQPAVAVTQPTMGATGVPVNQALTATFSQQMNSATITPSTFTLSVTGGAAVAGIVSYNATNAVATFTPNASLAYGTSYTATITTGATSAAGVPLASNYSWTFTTATNPNQVTVDFSTTYQTIRGFGGSTAWLGQLTTQQATALFNQTDGLGLSILRVRIDPTGSAPNWATSNWAQELANAQEAIAANSNAIVFATPWTPPASMKTSNSTYPYNTSCSDSYSSSNLCGGILNATSYAAYANYLEDFVNYFAAGSPAVNLYAISMQNEPDAQNVGYESCYWTGATMDAWVASLTAGGATNPITTELMMPESESFNSSYSDPTLDDPNAAGNVSIIAGHLYMNGTSPGTPSYYANAESAGKDVWMTEHYLLPAGSQPAIGDALALAQEIHNSMTVGDYNAYVYWWIWDDPADAINYGLINSSTSSPSPTYYGYAIGQFAKFIQPGFVRASATANPISGVYLSAYTYMGSGPYRYVIVAINSNSISESLTFAVNSGTATSLTPYETTSAGGLMLQSAVSVSGGQFSYTLPAQSIVTFVQ